MDPQRFADTRRRLRSIVRSPRYREAYPSLNVGEAKRHDLAGENHVVWRDKQGPIGFGAARWEENSKLTLRYAICEMAYLAPANSVIGLVITTKGSAEASRLYAKCPQCHRDVGVIVFKDRWMCGRCALLPNRSSLLAEDVRQSERLVQLRGDTLFGRTRSESTRKYQAKLDEIDVLEAALPNGPIAAKASFEAIVHTEWVQPLAPGHKT